MLERIAALKELCPGLETPIDIILRAAHLSYVAGSPLRVAPILLQGPPGVGKTHFARHLARALGVPSQFIAMDTLSDRGVLTGLAPTWKAARPGKIAETLLGSDVATCLFVCDEIDKVSASHQYEKPLAFLHSVLETENSKAFTDEYLAFPMRVDHCIWIFTGNDETVLPSSVLDRLLVLRLQEPNFAQALKIGGLIYRDSNAAHRNWFDDTPKEAVISVLARCNPRRAARVLDLAMGLGAQAGRRDLTTSDIEGALLLFDDSDPSRGKAGFVSHR